MRITNKLLNSVLSEKDTYRAAYRAGGNRLLVTLVFCELLAAHCVEVYDPPSKEGEPKHLYKLRDAIDVSLLDEMEQIIARNLTEFRSFQSLLERALIELAPLKRNIPTQISPTLAGKKPVKDKEYLVTLYQKIIAEATTVNPITSDTGCN